MCPPQAFGFVLLVQCDGLGVTDLASIAARFPVSLASTTVHAVQRCLPMRCQRAYLFQEPGVAPLLWTLFATCVGEAQRAKCAPRGTPTRAPVPVSEGATGKKGAGG